MHPAYSVIFFTTASGAGYGLLVWLSVLAIGGRLPPDRWLGFVGLGLATLLIAAGLLASTAHLGRPDRAWRAFSQWRTSWLSREGVAAVATFAPLVLLALGWIVFGALGGVWSLMALATAVLALATVLCTGMIYQSLPTIRAWSDVLVTPIYISLALASGAVLALLVLHLFGLAQASFAWLTVVLLGIAVALKSLYWSRIDKAPRTLTAGDATGLGRFGPVRVLEQPHSQANFVMREMGYSVGRRHAAKLRWLAQIVGFAVPMVLIALVALLGAGTLAIVLMLVATAAAGFGVVVERWLFFAEAEHVVMLYYGREAA